MIDRSPWTFNKSLLVFKRLQRGEDPKEVQLKEVEFWVQLHDPRAGFKTDTVAGDLANYIGKFVASDEKNFLGLWRDYLRVRVSIDITKPLKRRMKLRNTDGVEFWSNFKYEHIPTICFVCGIVGHSERFCPKRFEVRDGKLLKPYGEWLRVEPQHRNQLIGTKWLKQFMAPLEEHQAASAQPASVMTSRFRLDASGERGTIPARDVNSPMMVETFVGQQSGKITASNGSNDVPRLKGDEKLTIPNKEMSVDDLIDENCLLVLDSKRRRIEMGLTDVSY
uniref:Zinc knuckle CX2CX4HX4C domain-containing protein n=1 Tax=Cannabis sativa TaxID=3483 RepID=A0A803P9U5_CANSA